MLVGVVTDCDSLSAETIINNTHNIDISQDLNPHHTTPQLKDIHQTCTACVHARNCVTVLTPPSYLHIHIPTHGIKQVHIMTSNHHHSKNSGMIIMIHTTRVLLGMNGYHLLS